MIFESTWLYVTCVLSGLIDVVSPGPSDASVQDKQRHLQPNVVPITPPPSPPEGATTPRTSANAGSVSSRDSSLKVPQPDTRSPDQSPSVPAQPPRRHTPNPSPAKKPTIWSVADMVSDHKSDSENRTETKSSEEEPCSSGRPPSPVRPQPPPHAARTGVAMEPYLPLAPGLGAWGSASQYPLALYSRHPAGHHHASSPIIPYLSAHHPAAGLRVSMASPLHAVKDPGPRHLGLTPTAHQQSVITPALRIPSQTSTSWLQHCELFYCICYLRFINQEHREILIKIFFLFFKWNPFIIGLAIYSGHLYLIWILSLIRIIWYHYR